MSDPTSKQAVIDAILEDLAFDSVKELRAYVAKNKQDDYFYGGILHAINAVQDLSSTQPDIIACGDCKHWICHDRRCGYWNHGVKPLEWCCHGERRTDG